MPTLDQIINKQKQNALIAVQQVKDTIINDVLVSSKVLKVTACKTDTFSPNCLKLHFGNEVHDLHQNAFSQLCEKVGIPTQFAHKLRETDYGVLLLQDNINSLMLNQNVNERYLVRSVKSQARAILSDKYRRIDGRPILEAFMENCVKLGLVPIDGYALDTKVRIRVVLPTIFKDAKGDDLVFGLEWGTSDFGVGSHNLRFFILRLVCSNGMVGTESLRQVHLGGRLDDNIQYSERTLTLDTQANIGALLDWMNQMMGSEAVSKQMAIINKANNVDVTDAQMKSMLKALPKAHTEDIIKLVNSPDNVNMPAGKTLWRLSNAVSFFAQTVKFTREQKLDFEELGGAILEKK